MQKEDILHEIKISVRETQKLFFCQHIGGGEIHGEKIDVNCTVGGSPLITIGDRRYLVDCQELLGAIHEQIHKAQKPCLESSPS